MNSSPITTRPLSFIPLPDVLLDLVEHYSEVEVAHRLKEACSKPERLIFTFKELGHDFKWMIDSNQLEGILEPNRFKVLKEATLLKVDLKKFFGVSIQWQKTIPQCLSWVEADKPQLAVMNEALDEPEQTPYSILNFIEHCREFPVFAVKQLDLQQYRKGSFKEKLEKYVKLKDQELKDQELESCFKDTKSYQVLEIIQELLDFINLVEISDEKVYLSKVKELSDKNANYIILITFICFSIPFQTGQYRKFEPKLKRILLYLLQEDFQESTPLHKGKLLAELLGDPSLKTLTDIRRYLGTQIKLADLMKSVSLTVQYKQKTLLDHFTEACLLQCRKSRGRDLGECAEELAFLARNGASRSVVSKNLISIINYTNISYIFQILEENGLRISTDHLIEALPIPKISLKMEFLNFLSSILVLVSQKKVTASEQSDLVKFLKPAKALPAPSGCFSQSFQAIKNLNDPYINVKRNRAIQTYISQIEELIDRSLII